eukprot:gnl/TRDRNA2_/TRDRNA2_29584_c0_seq1.p1 gnl/TRDRNA2_/TRDRNA2_29584_c0~~gnl/TRDRNA2_/TRDRNA2_29584_c0_seq1.p1  ORF type:complete len:187 (+),score=23.65 gnl/TRDRNA2_/TRDRNA2_29584_c0_seq1:47-607(+)
MARHTCEPLALLFITLLVSARGAQMLRYSTEGGKMNCDGEYLGGQYMLGIGTLPMPDYCAHVTGLTPGQGEMEISFTAVCSDNYEMVFVWYTSSDCSGTPFESVALSAAEQDKIARHQCAVADRIDVTEANKGTRIPKALTLKPNEHVALTNCDPDLQIEFEMPGHARRAGVLASGTLLLSMLLAL